MATGGATGSGFRARTGALTLLHVAGSMDREGVLALLEADLGGVPPPLPDEEEIAAYEKELEEARGEGSDEELADALDPELDVPMQLTAKGREMLFVLESIKRWLRRCPQGPLELGLAGARALAPMVCSWSATLTHALGPGPLTLDGLERALAGLGCEDIERRLESMVSSGQAEALYGSGRAPTYALTNWGREAISPIVAAVRYELRYPEEDVLPPDVFDAEAAFQMALPLIEVPAGLRGACRAGVRISEEEELISGSTVEVEGGRLVASSPLLDRAPETWITGTSLGWCEAVIDPTAGGLEMGGDIALAQGLLEALHQRLFSDEHAGSL